LKSHIKTPPNFEELINIDLKISLIELLIYNLNGKNILKNDTHRKKIQINIGEKNSLSKLS